MWEILVPFVRYSCPMCEKNCLHAGFEKCDFIFLHKYLCTQMFDSIVRSTKTDFKQPKPCSNHGIHVFLPKNSQDVDCLCDVKRQCKGPSEIVWTHDWVYIPNFGLKIRIFLQFAPPFVKTLKFAPFFQKYGLATQTENKMIMICSEFLRYQKKSFS